MIGALAGLAVLLTIILLIALAIAAVVAAPFAQRFTSSMNPKEGLAFRFAVVTVSATWVLLLIGGTVSATNSGLACPDWPSCYGSFFPRMAGPIFFEHGHRLFATLVGALTIVNIALVWRAKPAGHPARALAGAALPLVIWQGVLGGMTVKLKLPPAVTTLHLATSMAFLTVLVWGAFRLRPRTEDWPLAPSLRRAIGLTAALVYAQIVLGALVRHTHSSLACTGWPSCSAADVAGPFGVEADDAQILVHMAHRILALVVTVMVIGTSVSVLRDSTANRAARLLALVAPGLVIVQVFLGMMSIVTALDVLTVTAHLGVGALLLVVCTGMFFASAAISGEATIERPRSFPVHHSQRAA